MSQPTPADYLAEALRLYVCKTRPDSIYAAPLFSYRLPKWHADLGRTVHVDLKPDLVLRVYDPRTWEVLAQSRPGQFDTLHENAPPLLEIVPSSWMELKSRRELRELIASRDLAEK